MGLSFPAASALAAGDDRQVGGRAGLLLAANTFGAIVGTFLLPFAIIPRIGSPDALALIAMVNAGLAVVLAVWGGLGGRPVRVAIAALGTGLVGVLIVAVAVGGHVRRSVRGPDRADRGDGSSDRPRMRSPRSRPAATVRQQLWVTGTAMTLLTVDAKLMPILPLMLRPRLDHRRGRRVRDGLRLPGALNAGLQTEAVELVPSVPTMFRVLTTDAAASSPTRTARSSSPTAGTTSSSPTERYDIIVTDPPPPVESSGAR